MIVVPHGGFRMGATEIELGAADAEKPAHYVRFERGFAMSRHAITRGRVPALRAGHPIPAARHPARAFDRRTTSAAAISRAAAASTGNRTTPGPGPPTPAGAACQRARRRGLCGVAVRADRHAATACPARRSSSTPCVPAARAAIPGATTACPPQRFGNLTGGNDVSPSGRHWSNAFVSYGDGYWGPAPGGSYLPIAFGPVRHGQQCQRMGQRLLARQLSPCPGRTARRGSIPAAVRGWCAAVPGPVRRSRRARHGVRRRIRI